MEDLKGAVNDKLVAQMVAQKATVAQLVTASLKVTSLERYLSIFGRVFKAIGIPCAPAEWLSGTFQGATACWVPEQRLQQIQEMFEFRHELVHEIGQGVAGHWNIRNSWDVDVAKRHGRTMLSLVAGIEAALTQHADPFFPNLLSTEGHPAASWKRYQAEVETLESVIDENKVSWE